MGIYHTYICTHSIYIYFASKKIKYLIISFSGKLYEKLFFLLNIRVLKIDFCLNSKILKKLTIFNYNFEIKFNFNIPTYI